VVIRNLRWYIVILLMMATTVCYLDRQTVSLARPVMREQLHISSSQYSEIQVRSES